MAKVLILAWCVLLITISGECFLFPGMKHEPKETKLLPGEGFRSPERFIALEKRDDSEYSYSSELHTWNSQESEIDLQKRQARSIRSTYDHQKKKFDGPAVIYFPYDIHDYDFSNSMEIEDSIEIIPVTPRETAVPFRKNLKTGTYAFSLKHDAFGKKAAPNFHDGNETGNGTIYRKIGNVPFEKNVVALTRLLEMLMRLNTRSKELDGLGNLKKRRSIDLFKGVKSLTDIVKNVNPLEAAISEMNLNGSSNNESVNSVIKENAKNFLPSENKTARFARSDIDSGQCIQCKALDAGKSDQKRSDEEADDLLNMEDNKEISVDVTTTSVFNTHHHRRKGPKKHLKPKPEHTHGESDTTLEPDWSTTSSHKKVFGEKNTRSRKHTTVAAALATHKPHKKPVPHSHPQKSHISANEDHDKREKKAKSQATEHETTPQSTLDGTHGEGLQKTKDIHAASAIDGKPKLLTSGINQRKPLLADVLKENSPLDLEATAALSNRSNSEQESQGENFEKMGESIEVGEMKINIQRENNKEGIKGPMIIDTKVLISGSDPKEMFSIGKMKGLLLLGESQDFVSGGGEKDVLSKVQNDSSIKQDESAEQSEVDEDQKETEGKKKGSSSQSKNLLPSGKQKTFLDVLSGNAPFVGDGIKDESDTDANISYPQSKQTETEIKAKESGQKRITDDIRDKIANEEIPRIEEIHTVDNDNVTSNNSDSNLSVSDKDTSSSPQPQSGGMSEPIESEKSVPQFAEDNLPLFPANKANNLFPPKGFEPPHFPEAAKFNEPEESPKIFDDSESFLREVQHMKFIDLSSSEKSLDVNEDSDQQNEKQREGLQSEDMLTNEKHSEMPTAKEAEIMPAVVEELNTDSVILAEASNPKTDDFLPNMKPKGVLDDKIPKADEGLKKKDEEYEPQKHSTEIKEANEPSLNDEREIFDELSTDVIGKTIIDEIGKLPVVEESHFIESDDQPVPETSVDGELTEHVISPEMEAKDLIASGKAKGFMPYIGRPRFPQGNRNFFPEEKSLPKGDILAHGLSAMDKSMMSNKDGTGLGNTFLGSMEFMPRGQQKGLMPEFPKGGRNSERRPLDQQDDSVSKAQQAKENQDQLNESQGPARGGQRHPTNIDNSKTFMPQRDEPRGMAQGPFEKSKQLTSEERGHIPMGPQNFSQLKESNVAPDSVVRSKGLQQQFSEDFPYRGNYPRYGSLNSRNGNPFPNYYAGNKSLHDSARPINPAVSGHYSSLNDAPAAKNLMPGFEDFNY